MTTYCYIKASLFVLLIFLFQASIHGQSEADYCEEWHYQMDTTSDLEFALKASRAVYNKVSPECQVDVLIIFGEVYRLKSEIDSAIYFFDQAIDLAKQSQNDKQIVSANFRKAGIFLKHNRVPEGVKLLEETRSLLEKYPANSTNWVGYYSRKARLADQDADYYTAIEYTDSALMVAIRSKDSVEIPDSYHNLGVYHLRLTNYDKAAENLLRALELKENIPGSDLETTYYMLGDCYNRWKQHKTSKHYLSKAVSLSNRNGNGFIAMRAYNDLVIANRNMNLLNEASIASDSALSLSKKMDIPGYLSRSFLEKGRLYFYNYQDYEQAEYYLGKAYDAALTSHEDRVLYGCILEMIELAFYKKDFVKVKEHLPTLAKIVHEQQRLDYEAELNKAYSTYYEGIGVPTKAISHLKKYYELKDSISNRDVYTRVADLEKKYDTKKKELSIARLNQEKDAQTLIASKAKSQQNLYLSIAILLLILILVGLWVFLKLRKQQHDLAKAHQGLEELNQVKNRLFSIIAHDLRGMITPFQRVSRIFKHHIDKSNYDKVLELSVELEKNSGQLSSMLDNLLHWSLEQMNGYTHRPRLLPIKDELTDIITGFEQQTSHKKNNIVLTCNAEVNLEFDRNAFHVVFRNLIGNAIKYTENGLINIKCEQDDDRVIFNLDDTGIGMSEEQVDSVFKLEKTESSVGTQGEKGTGLGLNLVSRFVQIHSGEISVNSTRGSGTTFMLVFPVMKP